MQILSAFKYELMPNGEQARKMRRFAGACRFVFNKALALQNENYRNGGKFIGKFAMKKRFTEWRNSPDTPWLADAPRHPVDEAILNLDRAFQNFFAKRADFPSFKRKGQSADSFRYPDPKQVKLDRANGRISLPKLGYMRYRNSRAPVGEVRNVTVSSKGGKWYVSILTRREVDQPVPHGPAVGIDVGIARFATLSDGSHVDPLNSFKKHEQRLAKYQRRMSRKTKFSNNWKKAKARVQKIQTGIANARNDFLHKASTTISKNHALVCIEDLRIGSMSKSSAGTVEAPGKKVSQKSGLNKSILDQGWGEFRRQIEYKTAWRGGFTVAVPAAYTSQTCPSCDHVAKENRKTQALFACVACQYENNADHVGAINILARGLAIFEGQDTMHACIGRETAARIACEVSGAVIPPAAGTHRSDCVNHRVAP
jgi:putative transposase